MAARAPVTRATSRPSGRIRIIGGTLRGSRIAVPVAEGLRPTPDRVRETLFNWLQPIIHGARCLDLFAGSGAVGIEAISRGAAGVTFVEREPRLAEALRGNLARLRLDAGAVHCADAMDYLRQTAQCFDIVFMDPPFALDLAPAAARSLEQHGWLTPGALVYVELPAAATAQFPGNWERYRQGRAGALGYSLYRRHPLHLAPSTEHGASGHGGSPH